MLLLLLGNKQKLTCFHFSLNCCNKKDNRKEFHLLVSNDITHLNLVNYDHELIIIMTITWILFV